MPYADVIMSTDHSTTPPGGDGAEGGHAGTQTDPVDDVVRAAGCVVYRHTPTGPEVLIVHRPKYDDWDLPKGKREPDESDLDCAIRETEEESGYRGEIEAELEADTYRVKGRDKVVRWFLMRCTGGSFEPNNEVDEIKWLAPEAAREVLSYGHARSLVEAVPGRDDGPQALEPPPDASR